MRARVCFSSLIFVFAFVSGPVADPATAQGPYRIGAVQDVVETPHGNLYKIYNPKQPGHYKGAGTPSFDGDTFSFDHQLGALIDDIFQCFSEHMSGMDDNTVLFDGLSELLDPYVNGTMPGIFEFETNNGNGTSDVFFNSFAGGDLFPEGFEDPATSTPLDSACIEIGIDDTLDGDQPVKVNSALFEASSSSGPVIPGIDITSFFDTPWDGRLSVVFQGAAGQGIDGMTLELEVENGTSIFADGFESGDASAWTE